MCKETRTIHSPTTCKHTIRRLLPCRRAPATVFLCPRYTIDCERSSQPCNDCLRQCYSSVPSKAKWYVPSPIPGKKLTKERKCKSKKSQGEESLSCFDTEEGGKFTQGLKRWFRSLTKRTGMEKGKGKGKEIESGTTATTSTQEGGVRSGKDFRYRGEEEERRYQEIRGNRTSLIYHVTISLWVIIPPQEEPI